MQGLHAAGSRLGNSKVADMDVLKMLTCQEMVL